MIKKILTIITLMILSLNFGFSAESSFTDVRASLVNQNPSQVIAGDIVELRIGIENWGYQVANNVVIELEEQYPFELISDNIEEIGALQTTKNDGTNIQIIKFKLRANSEISAGEYPVKLNIYQKSSPNIIQEEIIMVDIKTKESAEIVYIDKTVLIPGKQETIKFVINNVGSSELKDLSFSWTNPEGIILPVGSDNSRYVKSIPVGEKIELSYNVIASSNANADLYQLKLKLNYENILANTISEIETIAGIYVGGGTDFEVVFTQETQSEKSFTISNIGSNTADSVTVKIPSQTGWQILGANSQIIGNLNKGDYTTVSFPISSQQNAKDLEVVIDYTNTMGERLTQTKTISFDQMSQMGSSETLVKSDVRDGSNQRGGSMKNVSGGLSTVGTYLKYAGITIILLIVGIYGFRTYRKSKNKTHK